MYIIVYIIYVYTWYVNNISYDSAIFSWKQVAAIGDCLLCKLLVVYCPNTSNELVLMNSISCIQMMRISKF